MNWEVEFYKDGTGREPVIEFLDNLPIGIRAKVARLIDLLITGRTSQGALYQADQGQDQGTAGKGLGYV
jgi:hypothetical protein